MFVVSCIRGWTLWNEKKGLYRLTGRSDRPGKGVSQVRGNVLTSEECVEKMEGVLRGAHE